MKRSFAILALAALLSVVPGMGGFSHASASQPSTENSRKFHFVQASGGISFEISGKVTTDAPLACNTRMRTMSGSPAVVTVRSRCRINAGRRTGQEATLTAEATGKQNGQKLVLGDCSATTASDKSDGRFEISCTMPIAF